MKKSASPPQRRHQLLLHDRRFLDQGFSSLAGVDEAGRGPLAGPVVASAVIVRDFSFECAVDDSKKMTSAARQAAYEEILKKCEVGFARVEHDVIDRLNILKASLLAMGKAVRKLENPPDCLLIDGPHSPQASMKHFTIVNGDALSFAFACASIVAKVTRDRIMEDYDKVYPEYGFKKHKGYGTAQHLVALEKYGPCRIHRRSFRPVMKAALVDPRGH